jgi:cobaltochelatase CobS
MGVETFIAEVKEGTTPDGAMAFLREAINAPDRKEVTDIVKQMLMEHSFLTKIELKIGDTTKVIENGPKHYLFSEILEVVNIGIHVALIGPAGSGKSTVCQQISDALDLKYYLQNSVTGTHELAGYMDAHGKYNTTAFRKCFEEGGLMLIDEVDTSDPGSLKWLNTALANGYAMFPDLPDPVHRHKDFRVIIAANTFGNGADRVYVGANQLDASTLDRFVFFDFGYDEKLEALLSGNPKWAERVQTLRKAAASEKARIVISPRASQHGAKLLTLGWKQDLVEERVIWKGIDEELKKRILAATISDTSLQGIFNGSAKKKKAA